MTSAIVAGISTNAYTYDPETLALSVETQNGMEIDRTTDAFGRDTGFSLAGSDYAVQYAYDAYGRFQSLTSAASATSAVTFTYSYLPGADHVSGMTASSGFLWTQAYESGRSLITSVENRFGETVISRYDYANDELGRRTSRADSGTAFAAQPTYGDSSTVEMPAYNAYSYNTRSEVTGAARRWGTPGASGDLVLGQQYAYAFDSIGNRITAAEGDSARTASYTANTLNQYTQRTVPDEKDLIGTAPTNVAVTVNQNPVSRQNAYWHHALEVDNATDAAYPQVAITAVYNPPGTNAPDVVTSQTGHVFVAKTPESFQYDSDGNLTQDGRFDYTWDGENRLIGVATRDDLPATVPRVKVEYAYDHQGRMVWKQVSTNAFVFSTRTLLWDGYNIVYALTHSQTHTLTNSYLWGIDLSGSLQGAGGVGGLLAEIQDGEPYFAAYDANGNVTEYISTNGALAAHYEYSPFGEIVVQSGDLAASFTHRFSTKPWCALTGLSEYEFRKYSPGMGRWLSYDPIDEIAFAANKATRTRRIAVLNLVFTKNRPSYFIDALGLLANAALPPDNAQACAEAEKHLKPTKQGNLVCFKGRAIGCVWHKSEGKFAKHPKILACAQAHEDFHVKMYNERGEKTCECSPKEIFFPLYERGELDGEECMAYTAEEQCLKKAMLEDCQVAFDPSKDYGADDVSDCEFAYGFVLESVITYKNHFCGKNEGKKTEAL